MLYMKKLLGAVMASVLLLVGLVGVVRAIGPAEQFYFERLDEEGGTGAGTTYLHFLSTGGLMGYLASGDDYQGVTYDFGTGLTPTGSGNFRDLEVDDVPQDRIIDLEGDLADKPVVYLNQNLQSDVLVWHGQATTTSGVATFYPTSDNTGSGTALCSSIIGVQVSAEANTASAIVAPMASVKLVATDKKSVTVNVINGVNLLVLGASTAFAPNGTNVYLTITCN